MIIKSAVIQDLSREWNILRDTARCLIERQAALVRIQAILSVCRLNPTEMFVASGAIKR